MLLGAAIVLGLLSWLAPVLIPVALATLFTFLFAPIVTALERRRVPRIAGVVIVVAGAVLALGSVGFLVVKQVGALVDAFPQYEDRLGNRLVALRAAQPGVVERMQGVIRRLGERLDRAGPPAPAEATRPMPVRIVEDRHFFQWTGLWSALGPVIGPFATLGLTVVLLIFMLLRREDLRDRIISLLGPRHLSATTRAIDDAGARISRYLLLQLSVNVGFGVLTALGLAALGVPYAALFGFLAGVLRYIPYVGAWIAALLPVIFALLAFDGWMIPLGVLGVVLSLDLMANMFVEPFLYGRGVGVSEAAALVMVAFWTWLWGPVGIILATPLTACLVVIGRHVPNLEVFDILLGDRPALEPPLRLYQRLLAGDLDEAAEVAEQAHETQPLVEVYDSLLVPALMSAARDHDSGELDGPDRDAVIEATRALADTLGELEPPAESGLAHAARISLLVVAARDRKDLAAAHMLRIGLARLGFAINYAETVPLAAELPALVRGTGARLACVVALPPGGVAAARLFCMRLRGHVPRIVVLRPAAHDDERSVALLRSAGADQVADSIVSAQSLIVGLASAERSPNEPPPPSTAAVEALPAI